MKVKICGITLRSDLLAMKQVAPDFCGLIFHQDSPRNVTLEEAAKIKSALGEIIACVGVFVDSSIDNLLRIITTLGINYVQLHGSESAEYILELREKAPILKIIKTIKVGKFLAHEEIAHFTATSDYLLFDTLGASAGGNGTTFNWKLLDNNQISQSFFISGGIGLATVPELHKLHSIQPKLIGVDANSKLELSPGQKDPDATKNFINQIRDI